MDVALGTDRSAAKCLPPSQVGPELGPWDPNSGKERSDLSSALLHTYTMAYVCPPPQINRYKKIKKYKMDGGVGKELRTVVIGAYASERQGGINSPDLTNKNTEHPVKFEFQVNNK